jgi:hypothetical protein
LINLFLEESETKVLRADSCSEKLDAGASDAVKAVDRGFGLVEVEGRAKGGEELGDTVDGEGIVGEDDNVVKVGEDDGRRAGEGE